VGDPKQILVTGSAGYVGSQTVLYLRERGYHAIGVDDFSTGRRYNADLADLFIELDITDRGALNAVFDTHAIDGIIHCAARILVGESVEQPEAYYRVNIGGTATLLEVARQHEVTAFVFSSTAAVYGQPSDALITEQTARQPINPYGSTKLAVEELLSAAHKAWGLTPVIFRYFNAAGADPESRTGEDHPIETHLIPNILVRMARGESVEPLEIFGDDYPTPDGTCVRDYIHVCDLAVAHELGIAHAMATDEPITLNLGTGIGYSVREVIDVVHEVTGQAVPFRIGPRREGDSARLVASYALSKERLGWEPTHSRLATIVETAWNWHRSRHA
jgi:UDP-glucose 4-epimerase